MKGFYKIMFAFVLVFIATSCSSDDDSDISKNFTGDAIDLNEVKISAEIDDALEQVRLSVENAHDEEENASMQKGNISQLSYFPECVIKLVEYDAMSKKITLDFGDGCEVRGRTYTGLMYIVYESDNTLAVKNLNVKFEGYTIDGKSMEGSYDIVRTKENTNGNFQAEINFDIDVLMSSGQKAKRVGVKTQELIAGADTYTWADNSYLVTGYWKTTYENTVTEGEVITPLLVEFSCPYYLSGEILITKEDRTATLDFGDGACDGVGVLTLDSGIVLDYDVTNIRS